MLVRGHVRTRWRRYAMVAASFGIGLFAFFLVVMVADGARQAISAPLSATIVGDVRVTNGTTDVAGGNLWEDYRPAAAELERAGGAVSIRYESTYITILGQEIENWSAGLLLGVDPADAREAQRLQPYIEWGTSVDSINVYDPRDGRAYVPVVVGRPAVGRLNLTLNASGEPDFDQVLTLTSGRLTAGGSIPLTVDCVVVGVFGTGLEPLDRFTAFMPIQSARVLSGHQENDPVANAMVVETGEPAALADRARSEMGLEAQTADEFAFGYMGSLLVVLYVAAALALALFLGALLVWLVHETGSLVRTDAAVISSLRAIGVPSRDIQRSYTVLVAASIAVGAVAAIAVTVLMATVAPAIRWTLEGLDATIPWRVHPVAVVTVTLIVMVASAAAAWLTARRVQRLNILEGLRGG
jgi:ABC-type lipoprotein release transport system permease subunit